MAEILTLQTGNYSTMTQILIIEDEADIREILGFNIEDAGYRVLLAESAEKGLELLNPDISLILLDVMLPGMSGYQFAKKIRTDLHSTAPIIFLTARNTENDVLTGFSAGGDDYIAKPFSINEVLARIKAVLRRTSDSQAQPDSIEFGALKIDFRSETATLSGTQLPLSRREFDLLALMARQPDTYFSRASIISELWRDAPYVLDRTIDVHIARIRAKLGDYHDLIKNKTGFGYYIDSDYASKE